MLRGHDRQLLLMALVVLGATGLAAVRLPGTRSVNNAIGRALTPVQQTLSGAAALVSGAISGAHEIDTLRERSALLEEQNAALVTENAKMIELIRENRSLRSELGFARERVDLDLMGASIIGVKVAEEPGNLRQTMKLNIGARDEVVPYMPVATHVGLVGQVVHVAPSWSDVMLLTDPASRVQGRVERSRHTGVVFGSTTGDLVMRYILQDDSEGSPAVQAGDLVYTSGLSQRFPPMLLIGQVTDVHQSDEQTHQEAIIRPAVALDALEVALVVRDWMPATRDAEPSRPDTAPDGG